MKPITLPDYEKRLKLHNWNYQSIQCASVWNDSRLEFSRLIEISRQSLELRRLFDTYQNLNEVNKKSMEKERMK